jgi:tripartite-type tricarboxylate transporter receptor subunit TctC
MEDVMHRGTRILSAAIPAISAIVLATSPPAARAQNVFFAGKTISLSTHSEVGGGYDTYLRLLSHHMGKYIPGQPGFLILNQPGDGGMRAINHAATVAPADGTFLTLVAQSALVVGATGGSGMASPLGSFKWVGNFNQSNNVSVTWAASNVKTLQDAMAREVVMGATGAGTASELGPILYNSLLGTRFKVIVGYRGGDEINAAMRRREVDGRANSIWASIKMTLHDDLRDGNVNVLIQMGLRKEKELPEVPLLSDIVKGDARKEAIARFMSQAVATARPLAAPPGVPDERVAILRRAFDATMKDADFLAEAQKLRSEIDPMSGEHTQSLVASILTTPKPVLADVQAALGGSLK